MKVYVVKVSSNIHAGIEGVFSSIKNAENYLNNRAVLASHYKKANAEIIPFNIDNISDLDIAFSEMKDAPVIFSYSLDNAIKNVDKYGHFEHATTWVYKGE